MYYVDRKVGARAVAVCNGTMVKLSVLDADKDGARIQIKADGAQERVIDSGMFDDYSIYRDGDRLTFMRLVSTTESRIKVGLQSVGDVAVKVHFLRDGEDFPVTIEELSKRGADDGR